MLTCVSNTEKEKAFYPRPVVNIWHKFAFLRLKNDTKIFNKRCFISPKAAQGPEIYNIKKCLVPVSTFDESLFMKYEINNLKMRQHLHLCQLHFTPKMLVREKNMEINHRRRRKWKKCDIMNNKALQERGGKVNNAIMYMENTHSYSRYACIMPSLFIHAN